MCQLSPQITTFSGSYLKQPLTSNSGNLIASQSPSYSRPPGVDLYEKPSILFKLYHSWGLHGIRASEGTLSRPLMSISMLWQQKGRRLCFRSTRAMTNSITAGSRCVKYKRGASQLCGSLGSQVRHRIYKSHGHISFISQPIRSALSSTSSYPTTMSNILDNLPEVVENTIGKIICTHGLTILYRSCDWISLLLFSSRWTRMCVFVCSPPASLLC